MKYLIRMPAKLSKYVLVFMGLMVVANLSAETIYEVKGFVRGKLVDGRPVIEHEEIPGYMMAMTMVFNVADLDEAKSLEVGDEVKFLFHVKEKSSFADQFEVVGRSNANSLEQSIVRGFGSLKVGDAVPEFSLTTDTNNKFNQHGLEDQLTVVTFMFTRCPVPEFCPLLATKFAEIQKTLLEDSSSDVQLMSITLDPGFDVPDVLAAYGKQVGADPSIWNFATGEDEEINKLARLFGVSSRANNGIIDHSLTTALIGKNGKILKIWPGNRWQPKEVLALIQATPGEDACCSNKACEEETL